MTANASRLRSPMWNRRRSDRSEAPAAEDAGAPALAYGTVLATAVIGTRVVWYQHARTGIWCQDAQGVHIGVISWGDNRTPSLQIAPADRLASQPHSAEAELVVRCGMAAWRRLFEDRAIEPALPVRVNPDLERHVARPGREVAGAGH